MDDFAAIGPRLPDPYRLLIRETVHSTNDEVRVLAEAGAPDGLIILAHQQLAGRGRRGAAWFSPAGESLAFSILVRPSEPMALWPRLALAAGLAVAEALEDFIPQAGIKWPNDVWIGEKKVAGILVEAGKSFAVIGIGLNVNTLSFPAEVAETATSIHLESGRIASRPEVLAAIIQHFSRRVPQIGSGFGYILQGIRPRCVLTGRAIRMLTANGPHLGTAEGIGDAGELLLRDAQGLHSIIQADEIRFQ